MRRATLGTAASVAALAFAATACGSSSSGGANAGVGSGSTPSSATTSTTSSGSGSSSHQVTATETEFKIALSTTSFSAGSYTFVAENKGDDTHALEIDGPGVDDKSTGDISPGQSKSMTVSLKAGKYDVYCPVANHKMLGMNVEITVS